MRLHQFVCLLTFTCASLSAYARIEGEVSRDSFWVGECEVADMAIRYRVGVESGEPLVGSSLRWKSGPAANPGCLPDQQTTIWLTMRTSGERKLYLAVQPQIRQSGDTYGPFTSEISSWGHLFCLAPGDDAECLDESAARALVQTVLRGSGFVVTTGSRRRGDRTPVDPVIMMPQSAPVGSAGGGAGNPRSVDLVDHVAPGPPPANSRPTDAMDVGIDEPPESAASPGDPLDAYAVKLSANGHLTLPGPPGELNVWIGQTDFLPETRPGLVDSTGTIHAVGQTATVEPFGASIVFKPAETQCMRIHPTGAEVSFEIHPEASGTLSIGARIHLYSTPDCSGSPVPKGTERLQVLVEVNAEGVVWNHVLQVWEIFWEGFLDFWGYVVALFFGLLAFLLRRKVLKVFGYEHSAG